MVLFHLFLHICPINVFTYTKRLATGSCMQLADRLCKLFFRCPHKGSRCRQDRRSLCGRWRQALHMAQLLIYQRLPKLLPKQPSGPPPAQLLASSSNSREASSSIINVSNHLFPPIQLSVLFHLFPHNYPINVFTYIERLATESCMQLADCLGKLFFSFNIDQGLNELSQCCVQCRKATKG